MSENYTKHILFLLILSLYGCNNGGTNIESELGPKKGIVLEPAIQFEPESYVCYMTDTLEIDGVLDEKSWDLAEWTKYFVDIEGENKAAPLYTTRAKMLWDRNYFYIAAEVCEPDIQAKLRQRDTVIFYDNDFEVFIDPDGDTHGYYEFEMNAFNTVWDLLLTMPYRDKGNVLNAWDINGLKSAVHINGTINDPSDIDSTWTLEIAFPIDVLAEWGSVPQEGQQWRINFSRVNWRTIVENDSYHKEINPETAKNYPEYNWVWSPQGVINMHYPEMWGYIQFSERQVGQDIVDFVSDPDESLKWKLRKLYYAQSKYAANHGRYTSFVKELLDYGEGFSEDDITIILKPSGYEAYTESKESDKIWLIDNRGRVYSVNSN